LHAATRGDGPESFARGNNDFALALYAQLRRPGANLFFSPFSIRTALGMTYAGARGETAAQLREALHFPPTGEALHNAFSQIIRQLTASGGEYELELANSLWGQDGAPLQTAYVDLIARYYGGALNLVDFQRAADAACARINRWVEDRTRQRIRDIIPSGGLDADTRLVLVNAVYFKGKWVLPFWKPATRGEPFYLEGSGQVRAKLMHEWVQIRHLQARGYQAVDLNYRGDDLSMLVLLPDRKNGLPDLEKAFSAQMVTDCDTRMRVRLIELYLPRFKLTCATADLHPALNVLGVTHAFDRSLADLSGIDGRQPPHEEALFISAVLHKAFAEVDEEGTEAAAATVVGLAPTAAKGFNRPPPIPIFRADHPFLFAIRERKSGAILFLGRIADPTKEV
jgi:serpin B